MESFLSTREFLSFCARKKLPSILYKVDFEKAFNTVDWCFLVNLLIKLGFPPRWLSMMLDTLHSSLSAVRVNGSLLGFFNHKRGLHQEDPLSPMLFMFMADLLNRFLTIVQQLMPQHAFLPPETIQYVDDTVIIVEAHPTTLRMVKRILTVFSTLSGLKINRAKSTFVPITAPNEFVQTIGDIDNLHHHSSQSNTWGCHLPLKNQGALIINPC